MIPFSLAALPDVGWLIAGCIVVAIVAIVGIGFVLSFGRRLVTDLAAVVQTQMKTAKEAIPVAMKQPFTVEAAQQYTPLEKHEELVKRVDSFEDEVDERLAGISKAASEGREKLHLKLNDQGNLLAKNTEKTDLTFIQVQQLGTKMDRILERLPRPRE